MVREAWLGVFMEVWSSWILCVWKCWMRMVLTWSWLLRVQDYITRRLQAEHDQIEEDERLVRQYRDETQKMRSHIEQLKTTYDEH